MSDVSFDRQPTLQGPLLSLRPLAEGDLAALYAVASDPLLWAVHPESNRWHHEVFRKFFEEAIASGGALLATASVTGRVIGSSRFHGFDPAQREVEIGWSFLARRCWGGTWNREMKRMMLAHAFQYVDRVVFLVGPENWRSHRAMEKIGGVFEGERGNHTGRPSVVYAITREAFAGWA